ncbi:MAG: DUF4102 domain-containing protein, partial [Proteobacteria bacterium]|nr:DUF4102 domain-containing protein [Pseudomonadota bacterium]
MINLTNTEISKIEPPDHEKTISDSKITGLKLRIAKNSGIKTFYLYYKIAGKQRKYRIGKLGDIGVPAAREVASKLRAKIALGEDPQLDRLTERKANKQETGALLRTFLESQYYPWAKVHQKAYYRTKQVLEHNFKTFMNKRMDSISKSDIDNWQKLRLFKGKKPSTINREMTSLIAALNKAVEWEIIKFNPLSGRKRLKVDSRGVVRYLSANEEKRL